MIDANDNQERINLIVRIELDELERAYDEAGFGIDAYAMALAHLCGKYKLDPEYAAKLNELKWRSIRSER